jgi:hypothetical protein
MTSETSSKSVVTYRSQDGLALLQIDDGKANTIQPVWCDEMMRCMDRVEREDVSALIIIGILFEEALRHRFWVALLISMVTVSGGLLVVESNLSAYCGLSGVLNGLWVAGALAAMRIEERAGHPRLARLYRFALLVLAAKIAFETVVGTALFTDAESLGAFPVPLAHLLGALGGWIAARLTSVPAAGQSRRRPPGPMRTPQRPTPRSVRRQTHTEPVLQHPGR